MIKIFSVVVVAMLVAGIYLNVEQRNSEKKMNV